MDSNVTRPAVDLAPDPAHPGLALLLALIAIPGSTVAWELPAGGLWIGVPLASPRSCSASGHAYLLVAASS